MSRFRCARISEARSLWKSDHSSGVSIYGSIPGNGEGMVCLLGSKCNERGKRLVEHTHAEKLASSRQHGAQVHLVVPQVFDASPGEVCYPPTRGRILINSTCVSGRRVSSVSGSQTRRLSTTI